MRRSILVTVILLSSFEILSAQVNDWIGGASGDWNVGSNWSLGIPTSLHDVTIDAVATVTIQSGGVTVTSITVSKGSKLVVNNGAIVNVQGGGKSKLTSAGLDNFGTINITPSTTVNSPFLTLGVTNNHGSINILSGNISSNTGEFNNYGSFSFSNIMTSGLPTFSNYGKFQNMGSVTISDSDGTSADGIENRDTFINQLGGEVMISNIDGSTQAHGIDNQGYLQNDGKITIDKIEADGSYGFLNRSHTKNNGLIEITDVKDLANIGQIWDDAFFENNDSIIISNNPTYGGKGVDIGINTIFTNGINSVLDISNITGTVPEGINCDGEFNNHGHIKIMDQTNGFGISNTGTFTNSDSISMSNFSSSAVGILSFSSFYNLNSATLYFKNLTTTCIRTHGPFVNSGIIKAEQLTGLAQLCDVENGGSLVNDGSMVLNDCNAYGVNIDMGGEMTNGINGTVSISNHTSIALISSGTFTNRGILICDGVDNGINAITTYGGTVQNEGDILLKNCTGTALKTSAQNFTNDGRIIIDNVMGSNAKGMECLDASIINDGLIKITNVAVDHGLYMTGSSCLTNNDSILIQNVESGGIYCNAKLVNNNTVSIKNATSFGISSNDSLINSGYFSIVGSDGNGISNNGTIINQSNGVISVDSIDGSISFGVLNNTSDMIQNHGTLMIRNTSFWGMDNRGSLHNSGTLSIEKTGNTGFYNRDTVRNEINGKIIVKDITNSTAEGIYHNGNYFSNSGVIEISNIGDYGLFIFKPFTNEECGSILIDDELTCRDPFINKGYIYQSSSGSNSFSDVLTNQGVYVDTDSLNWAEAQFVNEGIYIGAISGAVTCEDIVANVANGPNSHSIMSLGSVYQDSSGMAIVGSHNQGDNELSLLSSFTTADHLYIRYIMTPSCTTSVKVPFENLTACFQGVIWDGGQGTSNWFDAMNWSTDQVPTTATEVLLPSGFTIEIPIGMTGECKLIEVENNVDFSVNGQLNVSSN